MRRIYHFARRSVRPAIAVPWRPAARISSAFAGAALAAATAMASSTGSKEDGWLWNAMAVRPALCQAKTDANTSDAKPLAAAPTPSPSPSPTPSPSPAASGVAWSPVALRDVHEPNWEYKPLVVVPDVFTRDECARIRELGLARERTAAGGKAGDVQEVRTRDTADASEPDTKTTDANDSAGGDGNDDVDSEQEHKRSIRRAAITWLLPDGDTAWIYDRLSAVACDANRETFHFDVDRFGEPLQFTHYRAADRGHYHWHRDAGAGTTSTRKLAVVVQLSEPADYRGGRLQVRDGDVLAVPRAPGTVAVFPAYVIHRVTPVTDGERFSLVAWLRGPAFR